MKLKDLGLRPDCHIRIIYFSNILQVFCGVVLPFPERAWVEWDEVDTKEYTSEKRGLTRIWRPFSIVVS